MSRRDSFQSYTPRNDDDNAKGTVISNPQHTHDSIKSHHHQHRSFINHSPNVYLPPIRNEHSSNTMNSDAHYQKRVVSNATVDSNPILQRQNAAHRISSSESNRSFNADRHSYTSNHNSHFGNESPIVRTGTMNSNSSYPQKFNATRHSSFISTEELENSSTSHYKPYYAKKQHSTAKVQQNYANHAQKRQSYHVANPSITSNDNSSFHMANSTISESNSSYSMTINNNGMAVPPRQSIKKTPTFGPYVLGKTIGEGEFGKVKLGWSKTKKNKSAFNFQMANTMNENNGDDIIKKLNGKIDTDDMPKQVAIKLIKNSSIPEGSEAETKLFREINSLRVLTHPNIVRLEEVIINDTHIGIVLEYASGGEFYKYIQEKKRLKENEGCRLFAQLISGVQYMHSKGMAHRDLKLENLLLDRFENLIITDFGFVNEFHPGKHELMRTSCGSPCYAAPELVVSSRPYNAKKADLWSCGIILFAILAGYLPWDDDSSNPDGDDIAKLYMYITQTPLKFPDYIAPIPRDLLRRILVSNPKHRLSMEQVYQHQWLKPHRSFLSITPEEWDRFLSSDNNKVYRSNQNENTKPIRPKSMYSTNGVSSNSLVLENTNLPKALPPKESATFATIRSENLPAALAVQNMNYPNRKLRHESIDFSQLNNSLSQPGAVSSHGRPISFIESSGYRGENSQSASSLIYKQSEQMSRLSLNSTMSGNNSGIYHRRTGSAASVVLQNIMNENDMKVQENNNKFHPDRNRRARPMSYQPGSQHYEFKGQVTHEVHQGYGHSGNMSFEEISNQKKKKHSSVIQEEEETAGISNDYNNFANQKLERYNQSMFEKENAALKSNARKGRNVSEASGSTIGTPTINSTGGNHENSNEWNQQTRVPSRGATRPSQQGSNEPTSRKSKRFSLLSFYSLYDGNNSSKNQVSNERKSQYDTQRNVSSTSFIDQSGDIEDNFKDTSIISGNTESDLQSRIFSKDDNVFAKKANDASRKQYRNSVMVSDLNSRTSTTPKKSKGASTSSVSSGSNNGTPSTTRRVIDFFKRRSIRL